MTAPDRIWAWTGRDNVQRWARVSPDNSNIEYVRADLARPTPLAEALAVPEQQAFINALAFGNIHAEGGCQCDLCRASRDLVAALRAIGEPPQHITQGGNDE